MPKKTHPCLKKEVHYDFLTEKKLITCTQYSCELFRLAGTKDFFGPCPSDPSKCRNVGLKGKRSIQVTFGAKRENSTVLAVSVAAEFLYKVATVELIHSLNHTLDLQRVDGLPRPFFIAGCRNLPQGLKIFDLCF